jgi:hypothetical protein
VVSHTELTQDLANFVSNVSATTTSGVTTFSQTKGIAGTAVSTDIVSVLSNVDPVITGILTTPTL